MVDHWLASEDGMSSEKIYGGPAGGPMTDSINLNVRRARKAADCRLMGVKDALENALVELDNYGWDKIVMVLHRPGSEENTFFVDIRLAGCSTLEARGLMMTQIIEDVAERLE